MFCVNLSSLRHTPVSTYFVDCGPVNEACNDAASRGANVSWFADAMATVKRSKTKRKHDNAIVIAE